jgi:hypothetical protein
MGKNQSIKVQGSEITIIYTDQTDYISLTDIARHKDAANTDDIEVILTFCYF